jgi:hypothetical protein
MNADEIKHVEVSSGTRDELLAMLKGDNENKHLVFRDASGKVGGVIMGATSYEFLRAAVDIVEHPAQHGVKLKPLWDTGPKLTLEEAFGDKPLSRLTALRGWLYEKRLTVYERIGLRPAGFSSDKSPAPAPNSGVAVTFKDKWRGFFRAKWRGQDWAR